MTTLVSGDVIFGAKAIAKELHTTRQRVYRLAAQGRIPFFRLGSAVCARRSQLSDYIRQEEERNMRRPLLAQVQPHLQRPGIELSPSSAQEDE